VAYRQRRRESADALQLRRWTTDHPETGHQDDDVRETNKRHWAASDANDFEVEHQIYRSDAVLEYPQSRERIRGRHDIQASRTAPNAKRFTVRRIVGGGGLWTSELVLTYDGKPFYVVNIMEFEGGEVVRETQYFGESFEPGPSRAQWVELEPEMKARRADGAP
jgi:hypothetical protein